jgi:hypothetical protein
MHRGTIADADRIILDDEGAGRRFPDLTGRAALCALIAACTVALSAWTADRGLDFTDEGFYLNWVSRPFLYEGSRTQFGFIYHPVFDALGGDIASFRRFNVAVIFVIALWFCSVLLRDWYPQLKSRPLLWLGLSAGIAGAALAGCRSRLATIG